MRRQGRRGRQAQQDEPELVGDEWVTWGTERIWVVGETSGGAPYGLTEREYRAMLAESEERRGWARARAVLQTVFELRGGPDADVQVGRVVSVGSGLSHEVFAAEVEVAAGGHRESGRFAVQLPWAGCEHDPERDARGRRQQRLGARLAAMALPFRVGEPIGALPTPSGLAFVRRYEPGIPLEMRAGRQTSVQPWAVVAETAAAIHAIDPAQVADVVESVPTRRRAAELALADFDGLDDPVVREARAWATEHLPPPEPARLVHGDLLGQNILLLPGEPPAVLDWEYARLGDPAHDLAVVTRGVRRPFQVDGGFERLLEAYQQCGGSGVLPEHVRFHELHMAIMWHRDALRSPQGGESLEESRAHIRRVLAMAQRST